MNIAVEIPHDAPTLARRALRSLREVELSEGSNPHIAIDGRGRPLTILPRPQSGPDPDQAARDLARQLRRGCVGLVTAASIPPLERESIERAGLSWCDGRGALHLSWLGVLVHIDHTARRAAHPGASTETPGLGPVGIRALQVLLGDSETEWTVSKLAAVAAISTGQAHNVFRALEQQRLVETTGKGPRQRRSLVDHRAALDWLGDIDRTRRRPHAAATYLYGRTHREVLTRFAERATAAGLPYAITAAAGSELLGVPVLSSLGVIHVRVGVLDAPAALHRLDLEHLDADAAGRGTNVELWTDTGELGTFGASDIGGIRVAPPTRVWLDLARMGGRHADAAQLFREQFLERV